MKQTLNQSYIKILLFIPLFVSILACNKLPKEVEKSLRAAGQNRKNLEEVINHYRKTGERKKLKATYFLIANMKDKFSVEGNILNQYFTALSCVDSCKRIGLERDSTDKIVKIKVEKIRSVFGAIDPSTLYVKKDLNYIQPDFLIDNIDRAFKVWDYPWAKHLSFEQFCEFLLPYRVQHEPLQEWRPYFEADLQHIKDSLKDETDPEKVTRVVSDYLYYHWIHLDNFNSVGFPPGAIDIYKYGAGNCDYRYIVLISMLRSLGIAVSLESTPQWNSWTGGHSWTAFVDKSGKLRAFNGGELEIGIYEKNSVPMGLGSITTKVYRQLFSIQINPLLEKPTKNKYVPDYFRGNNYIDVTKEYEYPQVDLTFELEPEIKNAEYIYLAAFNFATEINPIAWARAKSNKVTFKNVGIPGVYVPVVFANNQVIVAHPIVFVTEDKEISDYNPDFNKKQTIRLYRKFPVSTEMDTFSNLMKGARFQADNSPDFSNPVDLYTIDFKAERPEYREVKTDKKYRYLRYISSDTSDIYIANIDFFGIGKSGKEHRLSGKEIGYISGKRNTKSVLHYALDQDIRTNFNAKKGSWVGIDLGAGSEANITKVGLLPRNNFNIIEKGNEYQLLYFDKLWISLGTRVADTSFVEFDNVPVEALFVLKNLTQGRQERIFTYENGRQHWGGSFKLK